MEEDELTIPELEEVDTYCECLQYVRTTHTSKEAARENKMEACKVGNWSSHAFFFNELVKLHREGITVRRVPPMQGEPWSTRFLFLDIDNKAQDGHDAPNVTADELEKALPSMGYPATGYTQSTSRKEFRWHILLFLDTPVRTGEEYDKARDEADRRLRKAVSGLRGTKSMPALADPKVKWQSCLYGPFQAEERPIVLKDPVYMDGKIVWADDSKHGERTFSDPTIHAKPYLEAGYFKDCYVPLTSSKFCKWLHREGLASVERIDDMEYDFPCNGILPYVRKGASKATGQITEGERHDRISVFMLKMYAQARACNLYLDEHGFGSRKFTELEIINSFRHYVDRAFETVGGYNLNGHVTELRRLMEKYRDMGDREYLEEVSKFSSGRHMFKTRAYTSSTACKIIESFSNADGEVEFESVAFRDSYLKDQRISLPTVRKVAAARGLKVRCTRKSGGGGNRTGAGRKPVVTWESLVTKGTVAGGVFHYVGKLTPSEKKFLQRNGMKMKKKNVDKSKK